MIRENTKGLTISSQQGQALQAAGEIPCELDALGSAIERLQVSVSRLEEMIGPVLSASYPRESNCSKEPELASGLANEIRRHFHSVSGLTDQVQILIERCRL